MSAPSHRLPSLRRRPVEPAPVYLSLRGDEGRVVVEKLRSAALGLKRVEDLGPGFFREPDGTLGVRIDADSGIDLPVQSSSL